MYWILILDNIHDFAKIALCFSLMGLILLAIIFLSIKINPIDSEDNQIIKTIRNAFFIVLALLATAATVATFLPSTEQMEEILQRKFTIDHTK